MSSEGAKVDSGKIAAAKAAAALVESGMVVGIGTGSTAALVVRALGERVASEGLDFFGIPTSVASAVLANSLKIKLRELNDVDRLDLNIDGADEVDPQYQMIKGRGGALLREKIVASFALRRVTVITSEKRVERLGSSSPVPVEVSPVGVRHVAQRLRKFGADTAIRVKPDGANYLTDGGNMIVDCRFAEIDDPARLHATLKQAVGVFETGLFIGLCDVLIVGHPDRVETVESGTRRTDQ